MSHSALQTPDRRISRTAVGFAISVVIHALIASGLYLALSHNTPTSGPTTPHVALSLEIFQPAPESPAIPQPTPPTPPTKIENLSPTQQLTAQQQAAATLAREKREKQREQQRRNTERAKQARLQREREQQKLKQQRLEKQREKQRAQQRERELATARAREQAQAERDAAQRAEQARLAQTQAEKTVTGVRSKAFYRYKVEPKYPRKARQRGLEGTTIIQVAINAQGGVTKAVVYKSSGHRLLDKAALTAVKQYRFEPHKRNGIAVAGTAEVPVRFELK